MKRIVRTRRLTPEEIARDKEVIAKSEKDLPELIAQFHAQLDATDRLSELLSQLKASREAQGLSLADLSQIVNMDRSALSKLENGHRLNPTIETLVRYAQAVGKRLLISLAESKPVKNSRPG